MKQFTVSDKNPVMSYGTTPVLNHVLLSLSEGEIAGMLGENGGGSKLIIKRVMDYDPVISSEIVTADNAAKFYHPESVY